MGTAPFLVRDKLAQALREFAASPRYQVFKSIQVGRLMPEECEGDSALHSMTFEELVEQVKRGAVGAVISSSSQQEEILQLILALNEEQEGGSGVSQGTESTRSQNPDVEEGQGSDLTGDYRSSVQLELELRRLLGDIRAHPRYESVKRRVVAEFWDTGWTPAPFEEALTISQLASLDLTVLFKKKMVSDNRIHNLCVALERVLQELSPEHKAFTAPPVSSRQPEEKAVFAEKIAISTDDPCVVTLAIYEALVRGQREQPYPDLVSLIDELIIQCSPRECVDIAMGRPVHEYLRGKVLRVVKQTVHEERIETISTLLQGPAVRVDLIARSLSAHIREATALSRILAAVTAQGLSAVTVSIADVTYDGFWTLNPHILKDYLSTSQLNGHKRSLTLDPFLLRTLQVHGRGVLRGKGRRNKVNSRARRGK